MPATAEPPVAPAPGPEINFSSMAAKSPPAEMPDDITRAAFAAAGQPMPDPEPAKPAPAPVVSKPEPNKPSTPPPQPKLDQQPAKESKGSPKELREAYERANKRVEELEQSFNSTAKEKADAYAKLANAEAELEKKNKLISEDYEPRLKALTEKEKRLQQTEEKMRILDYQQTPEWHKTYIEPINETQREVEELLKELTVDVDGQPTQATMQHFNHVLSAPSQTEAAKRARSIFGDDVAGNIANYRLRLKTLHSRKAEAGEKAALESLEYEKKRQGAEAEARALLRQMVSKREAELLPEFAPAADDADLSAAFNEGRELADRATNGYGGASIEQIADTVATSRALIMKAKVLDKSNARLRGRITELETLLKDYQASEPGVEPRKANSSVVTQDDDGDFKKNMLAAAVAEASRNS